MTRAKCLLTALLIACAPRSAAALEGRGADSRGERGKHGTELTLALDAFVPLPIVIGLRPALDGSRTEKPAAVFAPVGFTVAFEWLIQRHFLLGGRGSIFAWQTDLQRTLDQGGSIMTDYGALGRWRVVLDAAPGMRGVELFLGVPAGLSISMTTGHWPTQSSDTAPGFHVGLLAGLKLPRRIDSVGTFLIQAGFIYRRVEDRLEFENDAGDSVALERVLQVATVALSVGFAFEL